MAKYLSKTLEINAGSHNELALLQGEANVFYIINHSDSDLYVKLNGVARTDNYDRIIGAHSYDVVGRPMSVGRVDFYNPGTGRGTLEVQYAYDDDFDYSILKNTGGGAAGGSVGDEVTIAKVLSGVMMQVEDSKARAVLGEMRDLMESGYNSNTAILEGINTILGNL